MPGVKWLMICTFYNSPLSKASSCFTGWNKYYQLGTGDDVDRPAPTPVAKFGAQKPCEIAPGRWGTFIFCEYEAV